MEWNPRWEMYVFVIIFPSTFDAWFYSTIIWTCIETLSRHWQIFLILSIPTLFCFQERQIRHSYMSPHITHLMFTFIWNSSNIINSTCFENTCTMQRKNEIRVISCQLQSSLITTTWCIHQLNYISQIVSVIV